MDFGYVFDDLYELVCMNFYLYTLSLCQWYTIARCIFCAMLFTKLGGNAVKIFYFHRSRRHFSVKFNGAIWLVFVRCYMCKTYAVTCLYMCVTCIYVSYICLCHVMYSICTEMLPKFSLFVLTMQCYVHYIH